LVVEQARWNRSGHPLVLISIDMDDLKGTNDAHGHAIGDELLVATAGILRRSLRGGDIVARLGGDEFAILLPDADASAAEAVRRRVASACAAWRGSQPAARLSVSIGWAMPERGEELSDTFCRADGAMYEAKRGKRPAAYVVNAVAPLEA